MKPLEIAKWAGLAVLGLWLLSATAPGRDFGSVFPDAVHDDIDPDPVGGPQH